MLKRSITFEDFNGEEVTEIHYFNLTSTELIGLETDYEGGLRNSLEKIVETGDIRKIVQQFQKIILAAYGVRSDDGKRFIKNDQVREEFTQTAAYDALFVELAGDANIAGEFILGIMPKNLQEATAEAMKTEDIQLPSAPSVSPVD